MDGIQFSTDAQNHNSYNSEMVSDVDFKKMLVGNLSRKESFYNSHMTECTPADARVFTEEYFLTCKQRERLWTSNFVGRWLIWKGNNL